MDRKKYRQPDIYHRAFRALRAETVSPKSCTVVRDAIRKSGADTDLLSSLRHHCIIETDWIEQIEEALPHIDAAVREDRQFIRQEGETVPIEKARHVSRASVEHLSKHSNLITHLPDEGERLIPDKLFVVENLSNYAIYENRFLYTCLCYIRDFVTLRHEEIEKIWNSFESELSLDKEIHLAHRHITYSVRFTEKSVNDADMAYDEEVKSLMERMRAILHMVSILLATPLMKQVSEAPMLRPPITPTNLLRMNIHFKAALEVYNFLVSYAGKGYEDREIRTTATPFEESVGDEVSELIMLTSYLTFMYGNDLKATLDRVYEEEEEYRRMLAAQALRRELDELRARIAATGESPEHYMLLLEKRNDSLEADSIELQALRPVHEQLVAAYTAAQAELVLRETRVTELEQTLLALTEREKLTAESHAAELEALQTAHAEDIEAMRAAHEEDMLRCAEEIRELQARQLTVEPEEGLEDEEESEEDSAPLDDSHEAEGGDPDFRRRYYLVKARYDGLRQQHGYPFENDCDSLRDTIEMLENEYEAFNALFKQEWSRVKKDIRRAYMWTPFFKRRRQPPSAIPEDASKPLMTDGDNGKPDA